MEFQDLEDHFRGTKTYGMYLLQSDGTVKTAVIDVDLVKEYRDKKTGADDANKIKRGTVLLH